jgi:CDP-4-dehydro-6-deoxyglucose reductase
MPPPPTFRARLVRSTPLTPAVKELTFAREDGAPFVFDAGQWVNLVLPLSTGDARRSYSIASAPDGSPHFALAITHVQGGPGSTYLHALEPGAELDVIGAQGFFTRPLDTAPPSLFVATGTGVTPLRSMLHAAVRAKHPAPITLLFGVRSEADLLYRDELERLASEHANVRACFTLSRPSVAWPSDARRGYVQTHVRELFTELDVNARNAGLSPPHVYVCGLLRMVGAVRELLRKEMELPRQQVHTERYD